jgi:hypothetical protein
MWRILFVAAVGVASTASAMANWQYVKWGMSKASALAASKGEAKSNVPGDRNVVCAFDTQKPFATIPQKSIGGFNFQVTFCTDGSDKVTSVALSPSSGTNLPSLRRALISQYGQPITASGSDLIWNDKKSGNTISYWEIGGVVGRIEYKKMASGGGL